MSRRKRWALIIGMWIVLWGMGGTVGVLADEYRAYHFGFKKSVNGQFPSIAEEGFMEMLRKHGAIFLGDTAKKELYLTFDNGYENGLTPQILDVLKSRKVPAAFFVTGHYVREQKALLKRMVDEGHIVGNHSWTHPDMSGLSGEQIRSELDKVQREVAASTEQKTMAFLRPPMGVFSGRMLAESGAMGYRSVFWSIAYKDWEPEAQQGADYAYRNVMGQLHPGAVILLHAVSKDNAEALGRIIDDARNQGYEFKSLDQMEVKQYR